MVSCQCRPVVPGGAGGAMAPPPNFGRSQPRGADYAHGIGLDRTGHMSFLTGQDRTPKFVGQVLPDRTESGLIFLDILPYK